MPWVWPLVSSSRNFPDEPGRFGAIRQHDIHTGVDLYADIGTKVVAVERGVVVSIEQFTGPSAGSPWWLDTQAVLIEGPSGVVCYGEIAPAPDVCVGMLVSPRAFLGRVVPVLRKDKGRPRAMLHLELYRHGTRASLVWELNTPQPEELLDPTLALEEAIKT